METKTQMTANELVLADYRDQHQRRKARIDGWVQQLNEKPLYAFSWGHDAVNDAAEIFWLEQAIAFLSGEMNPTYEGDRLQELIRSWNQDLVEMTRSQSFRSTSMIGNVADEAKRIALAKLVERLEYHRVRPVAPGVEEFRDVAAKHFRDEQTIQHNRSMNARTQKEARYADGLAEGFRRAMIWVAGWKPAT